MELSSGSSLMWKPQKPLTRTPEHAATSSQLRHPRLPACYSGAALEIRINTLNMTIRSTQRSRQVIFSRQQAFRFLPSRHSCFSPKIERIGLQTRRTKQVKTEKTTLLTQPWVVAFNHSGKREGNPPIARFIATRGQAPRDRALKLFSPLLERYPTTDQLVAYGPRNKAGDHPPQPSQLASAHKPVSANLR